MLRQLRKTSFLLPLLVLLVGLFVFPVAPTEAQNACPTICDGQIGANNNGYFSCVNACRLQQEAGFIGYICAADQATVPNASWEFESGLGIPSLFGFDPDNGLEIFGWIVAALLALAAILALVMLVYGGLRYIASAGSSSGQGAAKNRIQNALFGLVLALIATGTLALISPSFTHIGLPRLLDPSTPASELPEVIRIAAMRPEARCLNDTLGPAPAGPKSGLDLGDACDSGNTCRITLGCNENSNTCAQPVGGLDVGDACDNTNSCRITLSCGASGRCVAPVGGLDVGDACDNTNSCRITLGCNENSNTCVQPVGGLDVGDACDNTNSCRITLSCGASGRCE